MEKYGLEKQCELLEDLVEQAQDLQSLPLLHGGHAVFDSLDYEIVENEIYKENTQAGPKISSFQHKVLKWTLACLVGVLTGITGFAINLAVENIAALKFLKITQYMENKRLDMAYAILVASNLVLVLVSGLMCTYIAPAAAGSGIPDVKAYLNGVNVPDILAPKTLFVKIFGTIGSVAGGLATGRQGPLVHTGACIAAFLNQGGFKHYHVSWRWLQYVQNDRDRQDLITCGAAAGVAAAFRAPVGGVLFAVEEVASWWKSSLLWRAFFTTAMVAIVLRAASNFCNSHNCGLYGSGGLIMYNMGSVFIEFGFEDLVSVITLGLIGGVMGSALTYISGKLVLVYSGWYRRYGSMAKIFHGVAVSLITSTCAIVIPWMSSCTACPTDIDEKCPTSGSHGNFKHFICPDGYYNDLASLFFNTNENVVRNLFSVGTTKEFQNKSLAIYLTSNLILAVLTYGTAVPSGLFLSAIICGATYGRFLGMAMRNLGYHFLKLDEGIYAVLGAASLLGGTTRTTVSICVILLELTNNLSMLPLIMLVLLISKTIGDSLSYGFYDQLLRVKQLPFLQEQPDDFMKHLTAFDVCSSPVVTLNGIERVETILDVLKRTSHNAFPVLQENASAETPIFHGLIMRRQLIVLLKGKRFFFPESSLEGAFRFINYCNRETIGKATIDNVELTAHEQQMCVDLLPYANTSSFMVVDSTSLSQAFSLFRSLGLRHLCIVPKIPSGSPVVGILTRHDFMPEHIFSLFPHLQSKIWKKVSIKRFFSRKILKWQKLWRTFLY